MAITVVNTVKAYEVDGTEPHPGGPEIMIKVSSHWNRSEFVVLETPDGTRFTVAADDLQRAIANAVNRGR